MGKLADLEPRARVVVGKLADIAKTSPPRLLPPRDTQSDGERTPPDLLTTGLPSKQGPRSNFINKLLLSGECAIMEA